MSKPDPCRACGSVDRWLLADGTERCPICHPKSDGEIEPNIGIERKNGER